MIVQYVFLLAAAVAVIFAVVAIAHRNPIFNVLALVIVFFAMAVIFAIAGMDFLAAIQVIVYSGAILVLFLFVVMLLNIRTADRLGSGRPLQAALGAVAAIAFGTLGVWAVSQKLTPATGLAVPGAVTKGTVFPIGKALLTSHLFAFELITLLLVAAIVGAVYLVKRDPEEAAGKEQSS